MKKNTFMQGAMIASLSIIIVKIIGVLYVIPFYAIIGEEGGALYGYAYNIYQLFLSISSAGLPFAIAKLISEYNALGYQDAKERTYKMARNVICAISVFAFATMFIFAQSFAHVIIGDNAVNIPLEDVTFTIRCVSFAVLVVPFLSITKGYLQGHKFITPISISQIIEQVIRVAVILIGSFLMMKVFHLGIKLTVGVSVFGAFVGGLFACIYLFGKLRAGKDQLVCDVPVQESDVSKKQILSKLFTYAMPFIVTGVAMNLYLFTDMVLVIRTLGDILHLDPQVTTTISGVYSTWASKLLMIVLAFTTGMAVSLLPNIVDSYTRGDVADLSKKYNKTLQMVLIFIVPLTVFLSIFAKEVWMLFYGESQYGPIIFRAYIYMAISSGLFTVTNNVLQGMSKYKVVYISVLLGMILNIILDVPLMILMSKIGVEPVYGAIISTIFSMGIAFLYGARYLSKNEGFDYSETIKMAPKILGSMIVFILVAMLLQKFVDFGDTSRLMQIPALITCGVGCFGVYLVINLYTGTLRTIFGEFKFFNKKYRLRVRKKK